MSKRIAQVAFGIVILLSTSTSIFRITSLQGVFSVINQFQLFILLPMIGAYFPPKIIDLITGMNFSLFSFSFIPIKQIPFVNQVIRELDYDQGVDYYDEIGLTSGSALMNHLELLIFIIVIILLHVAMLPCYFASRRLSTSNWVRRSLTATYNTMTLSAYVRILIQSFLFVSISCASEIVEFNTETSFKMFSLSTSFLFSTVLVAFLIFSIIMTLGNM